MKIGKIKNNPNNPRTLEKDKFKKLYNSILEFPKMMAIRPMVTNEDNILLGGNMRLKAIKEIVKKARVDDSIFKDFPELRALILQREIPDNWVIKADQLTEDEKRRFIIADNVGFGAWDWDLLANEWDPEELGEWGLEIPGFEGEEKETEEDNFNPSDDQKIFVEFEMGGGKNSFSMEIDPKKCDIKIERIGALDNEIIVKINGKVYEFEKEEAEKMPF